MDKKLLRVSKPALSENIKQLVPAFLDWFTTTARDLPWRRTRDPYAIWVSEIMLQQTQVKTVIPYWERWMRTLPTIQSLAEASPASIHKLWEGLGYYTRVRNMQAAAKEIVSQHGDEFPRDFAAILELPGIGRYTAGAIASIAFNEPHPILDGNVIRVLTRIFGIQENPREKITNQKLWQLATELVQATSEISTTKGRAKTPNCSHLNQSLMELGALICTPRQPKCLLCPVRTQCVAYETGRVEALPNLGPRATTTSRQFAAFIAEKNGRYLVRQRPANLVNGHLWEFPNVETSDTDLAAVAHAQLGLKPRSLEKLFTIKHSITRYRITLTVHRVIAAKTNAQAIGEWLTLSELQALAFSSAHRQILQRLMASTQNADTD